jgi:hypothetical protein
VRDFGDTSWTVQTSVKMILLREQVAGCLYSQI